MHDILDRNVTSDLKNITFENVRFDFTMTGKYEYYVQYIC